MMISWFEMFVWLRTRCGALWLGPDSRCDDGEGKYAIAVRQATLNHSAGINNPTGDGILIARLRKERHYCRPARQER